MAFPPVGRPGRPEKGQDACPYKNKIHGSADMEKCDATREMVDAECPNVANEEGRHVAVSDASMQSIALRPNHLHHSKEEPNCSCSKVGPALKRMGHRLLLLNAKESGGGRCS